MNSQSAALDYVLLLLLALIWSASFLLIKVGVETIGPATLTSIRLWLAALILLIYLRIKKQRLAAHGRALLLYAVVGVLGNSLPFFLISWGEVRIDSSLTSVMMGIMPIMTFVLAHFFIRAEPLTVRKIVGITLGFAGLLTLVGLPALSGMAENLSSQLAVLAGACCYAVMTVFVRTQPAFSGVQMATGATLVGAVTSLPAALMLEQPWALSPSAESLYAAVILAVLPTALAALLYFRLIHRLGATTIAQVNYLIPVLGSFWGVLLLGETASLRMLVTLVLVLGGIYLIQGHKPDRDRRVKAAAN